MAVYTTNFSYALDPGIRRWYGDELGKIDPVYKKVFEVIPTTRKYEESVSFAGVGLLVEKPEGTSVTYADPTQGYYKAWTQVTYALGIIVTREMYDFNQYPKIMAMPKMLAKSVNHTYETKHAAILNNAFTSGTGPDALYLCVTNHIVVSGGTYSNKPSTASDLSMTGYEQALIDIADIVGEDGLLANLKAKRLIVARENDWTAAQLLKSEKDPESNHNAINPAANSLPYIVWDFLTDPDAWFIQTDCPNGLTSYQSRSAEITKDNDFDTENAKWKTVCRFVPCWDNAREIWGSPGA